MWAPFGISGNVMYEHFKHNKRQNQGHNIDKHYTKLCEAREKNMRRFKRMIYARLGPKPTRQKYYVQKCIGAAAVQPVWTALAHKKIGEMVCKVCHCNILWFLISDSFAVEPLVPISLSIANYCDNGLGTLCVSRLPTTTHLYCRLYQTTRLQPEIRICEVKCCMGTTPWQWDAKLCEGW